MCRAFRLVPARVGVLGHGVRVRATVPPSCPFQLNQLPFRDACNLLPCYSARNPYALRRYFTPSSVTRNGVSADSVTAAPLAMLS